MSWLWLIGVAIFAYAIGRGTGFSAGAYHAERTVLQWFRKRDMLTEPQIANYLYRKWEGSHVDRVRND